MMGDIVNRLGGARKLGPPAACGLLFIVAPFVSSSAYWHNLLVLVAVNALAVLGLHLIAGVTGQIDFGFAALVSVGAYAGTLLVVDVHQAYVVGLFCAIVAPIVLALIVGWPILSLRGDYFLIATIALNQIVYLVLENSLGLTGGPIGVPGIPSPELGPLSFSSATSFYYVLGVLDIIVIIGVAWLTRARIGRALRAIRDDELAAESVGIWLRGYKVLAYALAGALGGLSGFAYASYQGYISPDLYDFNASVSFVMMLLIGGLGRISGAVVGAIIVTLVPEFLRGFDQWRFVAYGVVLVLILILRPGGIMGGSRTGSGKFHAGSRILGKGIAGLAADAWQSTGASSRPRRRP